MAIMIITKMPIPCRPPVRSLEPLLVVVDRSRFANGFMLGGIVSMVVGGWLVMQVGRRAGDGELGAAAVAAAGPQIELAIARAEELNQAAVAYMESCGRELADQAWREAGTADERYQLLTSFIAFSPAALGDYLPEPFEVVLWEELHEVLTSRKVGLVADGASLEY